MTRPWERYAWVDSIEGFDAFCVSVADHGDADRVATAFGAHRETECLCTFWEAWALASEDEDAHGNDVVQIGVRDGHVVALEPNGWTGIDESVAVESSRGGRYAALHQNVNAVMRFVYAVDGEVVREFDPVLYDPDIDGEPLPDERDLPFDDPADSRAAALLLMERVTGLRLSGDWLLEERRPAFRRSPA